MHHFFVIWNFSKNYFSGKFVSYYDAMDRGAYQCVKRQRFQEGESKHANHFNPENYQISFFFFSGRKVFPYENHTVSFFQSKFACFNFLHQSTKFYVRFGIFLKLFVLLSNCSIWINDIKYSLHSIQYSTLMDTFSKYKKNQNS